MGRLKRKEKRSWADERIFSLDWKEMILKIVLLLENRLEEGNLGKSITVLVVEGRVVLTVLGEFLSKIYIFSSFYNLYVLSFYDSRACKWFWMVMIQFSSIPFRFICFIFLIFTAYCFSRMFSFWSTLFLLYVYQILDTAYWKQPTSSHTPPSMSFIILSIVSIDSSFVGVMFPFQLDLFKQLSTSARIVF